MKSCVDLHETDNSEFVCAFASNRCICFQSLHLLPIASVARLAAFLPVFLAASSVTCLPACIRHFTKVSTWLLNCKFLPNTEGLQRNWFNHEYHLPLGAKHACCECGSREKEILCQYIDFYCGSFFYCFLPFLWKDYACNSLWANNAALSLACLIHQSQLWLVCLWLRKQIHF